MRNNYRSLVCGFSYFKQSFKLLFFFVKSRVKKRKENQGYIILYLKKRKT